MFGLEGSGFTISLGVTLLLVGLVVFYFKQRMDEWENKLQGMLNLNKAFAASHSALEQRVMQGAYVNNDISLSDNMICQMLNGTFDIFLCLHWKFLREPQL